MTRNPYPTDVSDDERLLETLAGHLIAFVVLMVKQFVEIKFQSA